MCLLPICDGSISSPLLPTLAAALSPQASCFFAFPATVPLVLAARAHGAVERRPLPASAMAAVSTAAAAIQVDLVQTVLKLCQRVTCLVCFSLTCAAAAFPRRRRVIGFGATTLIVLLLLLLSSPASSLLFV